MKKRQIQITFHNPNTAEDARRLAEEFISHAAASTIGKAIVSNTGNSVLESTAFQNDPDIREYT